LARKYAPHEGVVQRRIEAVAASLHETGARIVLDKITGAHAKKQAQLATLRQAAQKLDDQKNQERQALEARQKQQRQDQAKRHEQERARVGERLVATKARQDAAFKAKETERARRLADADRGRASPEISPATGRQPRA
jgi:hypothetical protein